MEASKSHKSLVFDGTHNVKEFITKCQLECSVKGYEDEKKANFLGCRLIGPAFDVYMRLSVDEKKDFNAIRDELYKEFEQGNLDREEAILVLNNRQRLPEESLKTFAYKLSDLVKLAYPSFTDGIRNTITKDYFVRGLHPSMQTALKSGAGFKDMDLKSAADEAVRLELAGVKSSGKSRSCPCINCVESKNSLSTEESFINSIAEKVAEKLNVAPTSSSKFEADNTHEVNWSGESRFRGGYRYRRGRSRNRSWL